MKRVFVAGIPNGGCTKKIVGLCQKLGFEVASPTGVFETDVNALEAANLLVADLNGERVDPDVLWAVGYAVGRGKTILGLRLTPWGPGYPGVLLPEVAYLRSTFDELRYSLETVRDAGEPVD